MKNQVLYILSVKDYAIYDINSINKLLTYIVL